MTNSNITTIQQNNQLLNAINELMINIPLDAVKTTYDSKAGTASITGHRNGVQYTTTLSQEDTGVIQTNSMFKKDINQEAKSSQIKNLYKSGYKQTEIANMLGISQPTVSNYLRK